MQDGDFELWHLESTDDQGKIDSINRPKIEDFGTNDGILLEGGALSGYKAVDKCGDIGYSR